MSPNGSSGAFIVRTGGTNGDPSTTTERMRIDAGGRVGIGTSSFVDANARLVVSNGTINLEHYLLTAGSIGYFGTRTNHALGFTTNGQERMRIDASGNVGIGTNSPSTYGKFAIRGGLTVNAGSTSLTGASFSTSDALNSTFWITHASGTTNLITDTSMAFYTASGSGVAARMRIDANGNLGIGTSAPAAKLDIYVGSSSTEEIDGINLSNSGENGSNLNFKNAFGTMVQIKGTKQGGGGLADEGRIEIKTAVTGTLTGGVSLTAGATAWAAISDERAKDIIEPITNAAQKVSTLRAVIGNYKTDPKKTRRSFLIAQDVQAVLPEAVDATDENELGIRYTETIPLLVAAIQEQQAIIEALTARIEALEGAK
jgi:hypothetical protein